MLNIIIPLQNESLKKIKALQTVCHKINNSNLSKKSLNYNVVVTLFGQVSVSQKRHPKKQVCCTEYFLMIF